jgi:hypothetical protein
MGYYIMLSDFGEYVSNVGWICKDLFNVNSPKALVRVKFGAFV